MTRLFANPEPIQVTGDVTDVPESFYFRSNWHTVSQVCNRWRTTSTWWVGAAAAAREYITLITDDGMLCTIYRDMTDDAWYMDRICD